MEGISQKAQMIGGTDMTIKDIREVYPKALIFIREWKGYPCREWMEFTMGERISLSRKEIRTIKYLNTAFNTHGGVGMAIEIELDD